MMGRDLEQRLKRIRRVPAPQSLDRRMEALFDEAGHAAAGSGLERRLKRIPRVPVPQNLDRRMEALFDEAGHAAAGSGLEHRLKQVPRVPAPQSLDRRLEALFHTAGRDAAVRRPWRMPAWAAAAVGLVLVVSFLIRGGLGPEPVVVEITPDGRLEQFLLGGGSPAASAGLEIFTRGSCSVETVWPADAPGIERQPANGLMTGDDR